MGISGIITTTNISHDIMLIKVIGFCWGYTDPADLPDFLEVDTLCNHVSANCGAPDGLVSNPSANDPPTSSPGFSGHSKPRREQDLTAAA